MAVPRRIYLFGDQTFDIHASLSELLQLHENPILTTFFERSCHALRRAIGNLESHYQDQFPRFSNLADLNAVHQKGQPNPALAQFLTCICQLGLFIR